MGIIGFRPSVLVLCSLQIIHCRHSYYAEFAYSIFMKALGFNCISLSIFTFIFNTFFLMSTALLTSFSFSIFNIFITLNFIIIFISLLLFNLSLYTVLLNSNYRNLFSYLIPSTALFTYLIFDTIALLSNQFLLIASATSKLILYPWTTWAYPIYTNINISKYFIITLLSKLTFITFLLHVTPNKLLFSIFVLNFIIVPLLSVFTQDILLMFVYSSAIQVVYIFIPSLFQYFNISQTYLTYYLITISFFALLFLFPLKYTILYTLLFTLFFSLVALPPFLGFYLKLYIFNYITYSFIILTIFIIIIFSLFTSYMYISLFNRFIVNNLHSILYYLQYSIYLIFYPFIYAIYFVTDLFILT